MGFRSVRMPRALSTFAGYGEVDGVNGTNGRVLGVIGNRVGVGA